MEQCVGGSARFTFSELCNQVLGAADYIAVAQAFHTVFLTDIPTMSLKVSPTPHPHISIHQFPSNIAVSKYIELQFCAIANDCKIVCNPKDGVAINCVSDNRIMVQCTLSHHDSIPEYQERPWRVIRSHIQLADHLW